jgi:predicted O-linked N-acetylglucosamine transferase (SPINDLY family)
MGRREEAAASYRRALEIQPGSAEMHFDLGTLLNELGQLDAAVTCYRHALEINPDYVEAHINLGVVLQKQNRLYEAEASYRRVLEIKPDYSEVHSNLGGTLKELGRLAEAEACCRRALEIDPDFAMAHCNLGVILKDLGQFDCALASCRRALEVNPDFVEARDILLFTLNYHPDKSGQEIFLAYREFDAKFGFPYRGAWRPHTNSRETNRRLKVGYVSPDFRNHSVRFFLEPLLAHHDKRAVEIYAYAELAREDAVTERYKGYVDHWVPTRGMQDDLLAERIRGDGIDILVDLAGHTANNRLGVFARKPAPVSVSWLGYGYTTGLTAVDYFLTDVVNTPVGSEELFSEQPWRIETPGYVYRSAQDMGIVSSLPALERGFVTFGMLTRAVRINHRTIRVWSEILKRVAGSRLVIDSASFRDVAMQATLAEKFSAYGISRDRLEIGCHSPPWNVLRGMDIGLDCFPHNSGTTLFETLYMGVPYITLAERPSVGRLGSAILEGVGHPQWIAHAEEEYVEKAVALASDLPKLAALRSNLRGEMEASPLMNEAGFARKVEKAYQEMFAKWVNSQK